MSLGHLVAVAAACLVGVNLVSMMLALASWRDRRGSNLKANRVARPPVSILRPLCGIEEFSDETIAATFDLDWPCCEIIFCVQSPGDPIVPLVRRHIDRHPGHEARLLIGDDRISQNPKLNNCAKGWLAARHEWIVMADSNVLMPRDYLLRMMSAVRDDTGLVISMPLGTRPRSFFALVECVLLNTYQARWQYAAAALGFGFAQGKNMLWQRSLLDEAGGLAALSTQSAEDAAATRLVRSHALHVRLVKMPFEQPLGRRTARAVWARHTRWARLRRATFPLEFLPEILTGAVAPLCLAGTAAHMLGASVAVWVAIVSLILYGSEALLTMAAGLPVRLSTVAAMLVRDLMLPLIYVDAWLFDDFKWHGHSMSVTETPRATKVTG